MGRGAARGRPSSRTKPGGGRRAHGIGCLECGVCPAAVRPWLPVLALTLLALALRLVATRGIWVDEAFSIREAQQPLRAMLDDLQRTDRHPPLHYLVLWLTVRTFGSGELAVRLPSIVAGTLLVPALFLAGRALYDRRTGLVAAALGAVAPLAVWYAQEARMYAFFMLFATLALWAQVRAARSGLPVYWAGYALATIALLWTHYFAVLLVAVQQIGFGVIAWNRARRGEPLRGLLLASWASSLAIILATAPLVPFAQRQLAVGEVLGVGFGFVPTQAAPNPTSSDPSVYALLSNLIWGVWGYHSDSAMLQISALWPLAMLLALALLGRGRLGGTALLFALAFVPALALFTIGFVQRDLFEVRYFAGSVPAILLLLARGATSLPYQRRGSRLAVGVLLASMLVGLGDQQLNAHNPRLYDFRGALGTVERRARPDDAVLYAPGYLRDVIPYYVPDVPAVPLEGSRPAPSTRGRIFLVGSFLEQAEAAAQVGAAVYHLRRERGLVGRLDRERIQIWVFGERGSRR